MTYKVLDNGILRVYSNTGVKDYCEDNDILFSKFNIPVEIDESVQDCNDMFNGDCAVFEEYTQADYFSSFNQPITIPYGVRMCDFMFSNCEHFNQDLELPPTVESAVHMLSYCIRFNKSLVLNEGLQYCSNMLSDCHMFNQCITIPSTVRDCRYLLSYCRDFDSEIIMCNGIKRCDYMLMNCVSFNRSLDIPASVIICNGLFQGCESLSIKISLPDGIKSCSHIFDQCPNYDYMLVLPKSVARYNAICDDIYTEPILALNNNITIDYVGTYNNDTKIIKTDGGALIVSPKLTRLCFDTLLQGIKELSTEMLVPLLDALIPFASDTQQYEFITEYLDFKHKNNLYDDNPFDKFKL